jgi:hypothetical protein
MKADEDLRDLWEHVCSLGENFIEACACRIHDQADRSRRGVVIVDSPPGHVVVKGGILDFLLNFLWE